MSLAATASQPRSRRMCERQCLTNRRSRGGAPSSPHDEAVEEGGAPREAYAPVMSALDRAGTVRLLSTKDFTADRSSFPVRELPKQERPRRGFWSIPTPMEHQMPM